MKLLKNLFVILMLSGSSLSAFALCQSDLLISGQMGQNSDTVFVCTNFQLQFNDQSVLEGALSQRTWEFGDGGNAVDGLLSPGIQHAYIMPGVYLMKMTVSSLLCPETTIEMTIVVLGQPQFNLSALGTSCEGSCDGQASVTIVGLTAAFYNFIWSDAGAQQAATATGLCEGPYSAMIYDDFGCTDITTSVINVADTSTFLATVNSVIPVDCHGASTGSVTVTASGGLGPYSFDIGSGPQSINTFNGLPAGDYTIVAESSIGCQSTAFVTIVEPPMALQGQVDNTSDVTCYGTASGTVFVSALGGTGPYTFDRGFGPQLDGNFSGLSSGDHSIVIIDANGCQSQVGFGINEPPVLSASVLDDNDVDCNGNATGSATVTGVGGTAPYQYDLGSGFQPSGSFSGLSAGEYYVTIKDANLCQTVIGFTTNEPTALSATLDAATPVDCNGGSTGSATVNATGGNAPYTFNLGSGPQPTGTFTGLVEGSYSIEVQDVNGCQTIVPISISEPDELMVEFAAGSSMSLCPNNGATQLDVLIAGGTPPFSSMWTSSPDLEVISITAAVLTPTVSSVESAYSVTVTDFNGCEATDMIQLNSTASSLQGTITMGDLPCIDCEVIRYEHHAAEPGLWVVINSVLTDAVGHYDFGQVENFQHFVLMADPNDLFYPMSVETFYPQVHDWNNAAVFDMCGNNFVKNIAVIEPMLFNGSSTISGTVWYDATGKTQSEEDPIPLIDVVVEKTPPGQAQGRISTNELGEYEFAFVPNSDTLYSIFVNIPGVPVTNTYEVLVDNVGLIFDNLDFCVNIDWTQIETCQVEQGLTVGGNEIDSQGFSLYPNPNNGMFTINTGSYADTDSDIHIMDTSGRLVFSKRYQQIPNTVNMVNLAEGYYLVQITNGSASNTLPISVLRNY